MPDVPSIDPMCLHDVPRVMEIERQCFPNPWHESAYITEVGNRSAHYVVARLRGQVVGYAGMWVIVDEEHITTIGVDPNYRGLGIGERLLVDILDAGLQRGVRRATLEVRQGNKVAQRLYQKYGFETVAIRRGYYSDNHENALVMWIDDMLSPEWLRTYSRLKAALEGKEEAACATDEAARH